MHRGTAFVEDTTFGFFLYGQSVQHLFFKNHNGKTKALPCCVRAIAFRCENCGAVTLWDSDALLEKAQLAERAQEYQTALSFFRLLEKWQIETDFVKKRIHEIENMS